MYLHASGSKEETIKLLQQYGLSIGNDSIDKILHTMASRQEEELKELGKNLVTTPYNLIYDNINIHVTVAQQRGNNKTGCSMEYAVLCQSPLGPSICCPGVTST